MAVFISAASTPSSSATIHHQEGNKHLNITSNLKGFDSGGQSQSRRIKFKKPWTPVRTKGCLVTKDMRQHKLFSQLSPLVQKMLNTYSESGAPIDGKDDQANSKIKATWCASPFVAKRGGVSTDSTDDGITLPNDVYAHTRGKWIIPLDDLSNSSLDQVWRKLCRLSKKGQLPQCNSKLKQSAIWVYCNVARAKEVFQVLRKEILLQQGRYIVHGECLLQASGIQMIQIRSKSDR